jgi:AcrR family transcriptional regulator
MMMSATQSSRRPRTSRGGRPAGASPEDVLREARRAFHAGVRVDARAIAEKLGISRTSIYRWYGARDGLMGAVLAAEFRYLVDTSEAAEGRGAERIRATVLTVCATMAQHAGFAAYLNDQKLEALRVITASDGRVQPASVERVRALIDRAVELDDYRPRLEPALLAYTLIRLVDGFVYTSYDDARVALNTDLTQLDAVLTALL